MEVTLADVATISRRQTELVINFASTPTAVTKAMKTILESNLGLNPQQDGLTIYIKMPKITTEHRMKIIAAVKALGQKTKDRLKDPIFQQRFYHRHENDIKISKELKHNVATNLNYYIKQKQNRIGEIIAQKVDTLEQS